VPSGRGTSNEQGDPRYVAQVNRTRRAALVLVPVALALGACAGRAGTGTSPSATPDATTIASRMAWAGIAPELVYVTDLDGFELATQSVGVMGDDGMSAVYVRYDGDTLGTVMLTTSRNPAPSAVPCADLPDSAEPVLRCAVERGVAQVVLEGEGVEPTILRAAGESVREPRPDELAGLFVDLPTPAPPVERGDLPPGGDGAPMDEPGLGG
jgi:hypothetical protein